MNSLKRNLLKIYKSSNAKYRVRCYCIKTSGFSQGDRRLGYPHISDVEPEKLNPFQRIYRGYFQFIEETKKLWKEMKEHLYMDPLLAIHPGDVDVQWKFDGDAEILNKWLVTCDSDFLQGFSKATLTLSPTGTGVFSGTVSTRVPKDGKQHRAGFCNLKSVPLRGPFKTDKFYQWSSYTHLILRVRGDGRSYMINLHLNNEHDITWADLHSFPLYTRGGPYWQYVKIPFSKFFLCHGGRIQDTQFPVRLYDVAGIGITCMGLPGHFKLEIDYIGCERDPKHIEEFAYELYTPPHPFYV